MKNLVQIVLLGIVIAYGGIACSAGDVIIRTQVEPSSPWVGQKVTLTIDVLARDSWATINSFPLLDVPGAHLLRYETQGTRLNENISGVSYSGQRYEVLLFAHQSGELTIDPFPVEVSVKTWGTDASTRTENLTTEPLSLSVVPQDGVDPGSYLPATSKFDAKQAWSSGEKEYQTGEVIERTVTRKAEDVSAMVFTPFQLPQIDGMSCYPVQPGVNDSFNRGVLAGTRIDKVSCMLERAGEYSFPDITVSYWNISTKTVDSTSLPGISFTVNGSGEVQASDGKKLNAERGKSIWLPVTAGVVLFGMSLYFFLTKFRLRAQTWQNRRKNSEKYLFKQVEKAFRGGDHYIALAAIMRWLDQLPGLPRPARLDEFARRCGGEEILSIVKDLSSQTSWTGQQRLALYGALKRGRINYFRLNKSETTENSELPFVGLSLNS